jgi:hypothetical protein
VSQRKLSIMTSPVTAKTVERNAKTRELAINMLPTIVRNIVFHIHAAVPFIGNNFGRSMETDDNFFMLQSLPTEQYAQLVNG